MEKIKNWRLFFKTHVFASIMCDDAEMALSNFHWSRNEINIVVGQFHRIRLIARGSIELKCGWLLGADLFFNCTNE